MEGKDRGWSPKFKDSAPHAFPTVWTPKPGKPRLQPLGKGAGEVPPQPGLVLACGWSQAARTVQRLPPVPSLLRSSVLWSEQESLLGTIVSLALIDVWARTDAQLTPHTWLSADTKGHLEMRRVALHELATGEPLALVAPRGPGKRFHRKTEDICSKNPYVTVRFDAILAPFNFKKRETCFNFLLGKYATILSQRRTDVSFSLKSLRVFNQR